MRRVCGETAFWLTRFPSYDRFHSKSLATFGVGETRYFIKHRKRREDFEFLTDFLPPKAGDFACLRPNEAPPQTDETCYMDVGHSE